MKRHLVTSLLMTVVTTVLLGVVFPLLITGLAQLFFPEKANGQLILRNGVRIGSRIIGQPFTGPQYFHGRPSSAGAGYDAGASSGSNFGPTNHVLVDRVKKDVAALHAENPDAPIPVDLVTSSGSGLDPDISPAAALFQVPRISRARSIPLETLRQLVAEHTRGRDFGFLGEPRVNVLELNLALDESVQARTGALSAERKPPALR